MFTLCVCFKPSPLISKQVEMKYGKQGPNKERGDPIQSCQQNL